jgi:hypothetical protein
MNNLASNKESSKPSKSIKQSHRVEAQVAHRKKTKSEVVPETGCEASEEAENGIHYDGTCHETTPAGTASIEKVVLLPMESVKTTETADEPASLANRKIMGKLRRAFRKAGKSEASETEIMAFLTSLLQANVPVLNRSSGRIARVVKGEQNIESLLLVRVPRKSA